LECFPDQPDIEYINNYFLQRKLDKKYDLIFAKNSLDHGELGFKTLPEIAALLRPNGKLYLHVHLRKPHQLNEGHDILMTREDFDKYSLEAGLTVVKEEIFKQDPTEICAYNTLMACLTI
jgi:hypothetical protein